MTGWLIMLGGGFCARFRSRMHKLGGAYDRGFMSAGYAQGAFGSRACVKGKMTGRLCLGVFCPRGVSARALLSKASGR